MQMFGVGGEPVSTGPPAAASTTAAATQSSTESPAWAEALLAAPSILIRTGLAWGFADPTEDSSVLVLSAPSGRYVDVRFALSGDPISPSNLDFWAFAGTVEMTVAPKAMTCTAHGKWQHPIDSNRDFATVDEGDLLLLSNDDVIEIGTMANPKTGKVELYKEYWTTPAGQPTTKPCVVATLESEHGKGMIVRIGDYCQGIYQSETEFWVERWSRTGGPEVGEWKKDERSSGEKEHKESETLPCLWAADLRKLGDRITKEKGNWEVVEVFDG